MLLEEDLRRDFLALVRFLNDRSVDRLFIAPSALQQLAEAAESCEVVPDALREVNAAGERLEVTPRIASFFSRLEDCTLWNQYGSAESHVATAHRLSGSPSDWPTLPPIGPPITNTQVQLLDSHGRTVPIGVPGELYILGDCLARGYLTNPGLTAERFVPDPHAVGTGGRLYRTGDLARYRPDGNIEFLGRVDDQVKLRGYRIELGEIEVVLAEHPAVIEAVAAVYEDVPGDKRLAAYVVLRERCPSETDDLRTFLSRKLPDYMVPSAFEVMESLPVTPSGKVDRRALPAPSSRCADKDSYVAPRSRIEATVAKIWAEVLGMDRVGIYDNFFSSGGHSLIAAQVMSRIRRDVGIELPLRSLFECPTVAALAERLEIVLWAARDRQEVSTAATGDREEGRL